MLIINYADVDEIELRSVPTREQNGSDYRKKEKNTIDDEFHWHSSNSSDLRDEFGEEGANDHARHRAKEAQHHTEGIRRPVPARSVRVTCTIHMFVCFLIFTNS